jgi:hypothetical protein
MMWRLYCISTLFTNNYFLFVSYSRIKILNMFVNEFRTEVSLTLSLQTNYLMFSGMQVIIF